MLAVLFEADGASQQENRSCFMYSHFLIQLFERALAQDFFGNKKNQMLVKRLDCSFPFIIILTLSI